jgi:hypothetical protein
MDPCWGLKGVTIVMNRVMRIFVDIDNTICETRNGYQLAQPLHDRIAYINYLHEQGHEIVYWSERGCQDGELWFERTHTQLRNWGCQFQELRMGKPEYDLLIDDKNIMSDDFFRDHHNTCSQTLIRNDQLHNRQ